ncbi:MAG: L,D-transpeptidase [Cyanobacteriota bacterium]|nr:L,D-transpeptidase [Cyanobacteriota bacterium]
MLNLSFSRIRCCAILATVQTAFSLGAIGFFPVPGRAAPAEPTSSEFPQTEPVQVAQTILDEIRYLENSGQQWIEIDLTQQLLTAWSGSSLIYSTYISSGTDATPTPTGVFSIQTKYESTPMSGEDYYIDDVPYAMFFYGNYAIHGAYWHDSFGYPVSRGCVNMPTGDAEWLYYWAAYGTPVVVRY